MAEGLFRKRGSGLCDPTEPAGKTVEATDHHVGESVEPEK